MCDYYPEPRHARLRGGADRDVPATGTCLACAQAQRFFRRMAERKAHAQARHRRRRQLQSPCYIARLRKIQTEKAAASPRSNGSSPRPPRGGIYHIRASSGNRRTRDWEVSLAPVSAVCRSLPVAHKRQGCSEYRAYRETTPEHPRNTGPLGKSGIQTRRETHGLNSNELRIPTLWGKNTDPTGKYETLDRRQRTLRCRRWWHIYRPTAVFRGKVRAVRRRLPVTDLMGKDYRSSWVSLPILWGKITDPPR